jgi:hypothetical protein
MEKLLRSLFVVALLTVGLIGVAQSQQPRLPPLCAFVCLCLNQQQCWCPDYETQTDCHSYMCGSCGFLPMNGDCCY